MLSGVEVEVAPDVALRYLMSSVWVFRVNDFRVNNMTTIKQQKTRETSLNQMYPFCSSTKKEMLLPDTSAAFHFEYAVHYYPSSAPFITGILCQELNLSAPLLTVVSKGSMSCVM